MTRTQRRRHLAMWLIIGPACLVLILAALAARRPGLPDTSRPSPLARP